MIFSTELPKRYARNEISMLFVPMGTSQDLLWPELQLKYLKLPNKMLHIFINIDILTCLLRNILCLHLDRAIQMIFIFMFLLICISLFCERYYLIKIIDNNNNFNTYIALAMLYLVLSSSRPMK